MVFTETPLKGAFILDLQRAEDERGFFARAWCRKEFEARGLDSGLVQCNLSWNRETGTLRGLHYQAPPQPEVKVVRCIRGAIYDVLVDLRASSPTFRKYVGVELTAQNGRAVYVPEGFAHGFITLAPDTEVFYQMSEYYAPECARGVRWDDPAFGIRWPVPVRVISPRDAAYPDFLV